MANRSGQPFTPIVLLTLAAGAAVALLPRLALAFFAFPSADDYCIAVEARDGFWHMQSNWYMTWTGRYSAVLLEATVVQFDLLGVYRWFAMATLVSTVLAIRTLVGALCGRAVSSLQVTVLGLAAAAVFVGGLPSTLEAFYWLPGEASYQWGVILYLVWVSLLIPVARHGHVPGGIWRRAPVVALTLLLPGFNEVMAPILGATILAFMAVNRSRKLQNGRVLLTLLGIVLVLTAVSFLAPGNTNRSSVYPAIASRHNLGYALVETSRQTARFIVRYGWYPALWVASLAAWWVSDRVSPRATTPMGRPWHSAAALLALVSVVYLTLFPVYWEYGEVNYTGEGRTYNVTYVALCAIVVVTTGFLLRLIPGRFIERLRGRGGRVDVLLAGTLMLLVVASPSTRSVFEALRMAPAYLEAERARADDLATSPRSGVVFVDTIPVRPPGLFWSDVQNDATHWINVCVAKYYRLEAVRSRM